jgi:hypothetical protein
VRIDGEDVSEPFMRDLLDITVENSLHMPDVATLVLNDPRLHWVDEALLSPGKAVEIEATAAKDSESKLIFDGEIV